MGIGPAWAGADRGPAPSHGLSTLSLPLLARERTQHLREARPPPHRPRLLCRGPQPARRDLAALLHPQAAPQRAGVLDRLLDPVLALPFRFGHGVSPLSASIPAPG